ncbi:MAG: PIN domain-containing protein [Thermodesulfobacteriota bacterium]
MKFLIDTNIFLEVVLTQSKAIDAQEFLSKTEEHEFFISDYSLHSIGLLFFRRKQHHVFRQFLTDMISIAGIKMIALLPKDMEDVINTAQKFGLDFDDAYQYVIAEQFGLTIISFDSDFDKTEKGRKTPGDIAS